MEAHRSSISFVAQLFELLVVGPRLQLVAEQQLLELLVVAQLLQLELDDEPLHKLASEPVVAQRATAA